MKPVSFEGQSLVMGAPPGTPEGKCGGLPVRVDRSVIWPGCYTFTSYFKPSNAELEVLKAGGCIELVVHSDRHPPVAINVDYPQEIDPEAAA